MMNKTQAMGDRVGEKGGVETVGTLRCRSEAHQPAHHVSESYSRCRCRNEQEAAYLDVLVVFGELDFACPRC